MTVSTTTIEQVSACDGVTTVFPVAFQYGAAADLVVELIDPATLAVLETLIDGDDYTRSGADGMAAPTSITTASAHPSGKSIRRRRATPLTQTLDAVPGQIPPSLRMEAAWDKAMLALQERKGETAELFSRALMVPIGETPPVVEAPALEGGVPRLAVLMPFGGGYRIEWIEAGDVPGTQGDPGGTTDAFGPFAGIGAQSFPPGVRRIRSSCFSELTDEGNASYREMFAPETGFGIETRYRKLDADGRCWMLSEPIVNVKMLGAKGDYYAVSEFINPNPTDDSEAIQEAVDTFSKVFFPNPGRKTGYWCLSPILLNKGQHLWGMTSIGSTAVSTKATAIVSNNGDTILNLRTRNAQTCVIEGLTLYCPPTDLGVSRSTHGIDVTPLRTTLRNLHIFACNVGIGGISGTSGEHSNIYNVHVVSCEYGARRLRDSHWNGGRVAANQRCGILLGSGNSDNKLFLKYDFNGDWGLEANGCNDLKIEGDFDANGKGGLKLADCNRIGGMFNTTRNGRNDTGTNGEDTNIYLKNVQALAFQIVTGRGLDDDGNPPDTPRFMFTLDGATKSRGTIMGDTRGFSTAFLNLMNSGTPDGIRWFTNTGYEADGGIGGGLQVKSSALSAGQSEVLTFPVPYHWTSISDAAYDLFVTLKLSTSSANHPRLRIPLSLLGWEATTRVKFGTGADSIDGGSASITVDGGGGTVIDITAAMTSVSGQIAVAFTVTADAALSGTVIATLRIS